MIQNDKKLTVQDCRKYLPAELRNKLPDKDLLAIRDFFYNFSEMIVNLKPEEKRNVA
jgi:hypothetical protein